MTYRVVMIGAGAVTTRHVPAWLKQGSRATLTAIADPDPVKLAERAAQAGNVRTYGQAEAMLAAERPDIVDIAAPREFHAEMIALAQSHGAAILCQKPLAPDLASARAVVASLAPETRLMVHENWRFRAYYRDLKRWLDAEVAGPIHRVRLDFLSSGMIADETGQRPALVRQPFFSGLRRLAVTEILIHHLDTLRFLFGELEVMSATMRRTNDAIIGEDVAQIALRRRSDGMPLALTGDLAVHGAPRLPQDRFMAMGARGALHHDTRRLWAEGLALAPIDYAPDASILAPYDSTIGHFLDCLESGAAFETAPEDNLRTLELVEAVYAHAQFAPRDGMR